jgi:hypothetical protein
MTTSRVFQAGLAALMLASVTMTGCVVTARPAYYGGAVVTVAPPAPQVEVMGVAPAPGYVWMGGYWDWVGGRHVWVGGHWMAGRPGYHWVPHHWVAVGGGYRLSAGHWER